MNTDLKKIIHELKRRRVFRVAAVYSGFAFIIFQIIDATFETLGIPTWLGKYTIIALVLGFPIAVGLGWAFDITDKGVVRTKNKQIEHDSRKPFVGNISLGIVASIAIILAIWGWMKTPEVRSEGYQAIAVLPFDNYMGDKSQNYFVDGMTESIIAELARLEGLKVISRTSAMRYRGSDKSIPEIAAELGVDAIIEGSVLKAGSDVRITAQLIDGLSDEHLWAKSFDKSLDQILSLQRDVASAIAEEIRWTFKPEEEQYFQQENVAVNSDAYELYLKGWQDRLLESPESIKRALNYFNAATTLDSTLYQAHAAKVVTYYLSDLRRQNRTRLAKTALDNCLRLAPDEPETQMAVAMYNQLFALNIDAAGTAFKRVVELRPGDAEIRREYGLFLLRMGMFEEASVELEISKAYDPLSALTLRDLGLIKTRLGKGDEAYSLLSESLKIEPNHTTTKTYLAWSLLVLNRPQESYQLFTELKETLDYIPPGMFNAAVRAGHRAEYVDYVGSLDQAREGEDEWADFLSKVYAGDLDAAMKRFEGWYAMRHPELIGLNYNIDWDPIRHRPEFQRALNVLGFPAKQPESFSEMLKRLHGPPPESPNTLN